MHAYKKYRASPLTDKKNRTVSGGGKKLSGKLKFPPPPHQKSNGPSLTFYSFGFFVYLIAMAFLTKARTLGLSSCKFTHTACGWMPRFCQ